MIIRSQDKRNITTDLNLQIYTDDWSDMFGIVNSKGVELGLYSSEEQAIKVLDLVQNEFQSELRKHRVFQMPQDSEVRL
jgi:hypothetical protein